MPPSSSSDDLDFLLGLEIVVDVGRQDDFVLLDEEPRRLQADDQVLPGDDLGLALADLGAVAHRPDFDLPGGEVLGHGNSTSAMPSLSVVSAAAQKAVSAKFLRTSAGPAPVLPDLDCLRR